MADITVLVYTSQCLSATAEFLKHVLHTTVNNAIGAHYKAKICVKRSNFAFFRLTKLCIFNNLHQFREISSRWLRAIELWNGSKKVTYIICARNHRAILPSRITRLVARPITAEISTQAGHKEQQRKKGISKAARCRGFARNHSILLCNCD